MKLKQFREFFTNELSEVYPKTEIDSFFFLMAEHHLGLQKIDAVLNTHIVISSEKLTLLTSIVNRLKNEEPIQYILGETTFYNATFLVNKNTLIPRPETEELVDWIILEAKKTPEKKLNILDIGTGTGCIAISLAKNIQNATVSAIDVSAEALKTAKQNAMVNNANVEFLQTDILQTKTLSNAFDFVVSNPPYVRNLEKKEMKNNVLKNEPHIALFVDDNNPLLFYNKIADLAKKHLTKNGFLFFEINQYLANETTNMLHEKGFKNIELRKDLFGNNRMIKANL